MQRTLTLKRDALTDLTTDELGDVRAAAIPTILGVCDWTQQSSPINCVTRHTVCFCK